MTEIKNQQNQNIRNRKINLSKVNYMLPEIDDDRYMLDSEYIEQQEESTQNWLDNMSEKSQYDITESLCVAW